ncbi:MAG: hypothetical protein JJE50_15230 [Actinomycetales bacterium]|nr:hypothetical protein [Actinomycetales bacterium]
MSSTEETPATNPGLGAEPDTDQLPREDTLEQRGVEDLLDEGYSPPERDRSNHFGETPYEEASGESLDRRLVEEAPETWEEGGDIVQPERQADRAGRLADVGDSGREQDNYAEDVGVAGGAASAEEAAMHVIDDDDPEYVRAQEDGGPDPEQPSSGIVSPDGTLDDEPGDQDENRP